MTYPQLSQPPRCLRSSRSNRIVQQALSGAKSVLAQYPAGTSTIPTDLAVSSGPNTPRAEALAETVWVCFQNKRKKKKKSLTGYARCEFPHSNSKYLLTPEITLTFSMLVPQQSAPLPGMPLPVVPRSLPKEAPGFGTPPDPAGIAKPQPKCCGGARRQLLV